MESPGDVGIATGGLISEQTEGNYTSCLYFSHVRLYSLMLRQWCPCHLSLFTNMLHVIFVAKSSPYDGKSSDLVDNAGFDSLLSSFELTMSSESPPRKGDPLMVLCDLQRRKDALNALDLLGRINKAAAKLR